MFRTFQLLLLLGLLVVSSNVYALGDIKAQLPWPNPTNSQVPLALSSASKTYRFRGTLQAGEVDMSGAEIICIQSASGDLTMYFNTATTKV